MMDALALQQALLNTIDQRYRDHAAPDLLILPSPLTIPLNLYNCSG
jgi:hypothetical protein